jgi:hypothetical protein
VLRRLKGLAIDLVLIALFLAYFVSSESFREHFLSIPMYQLLILFLFAMALERLIAGIRRL